MSRGRCGHRDAPKDHTSRNVANDWRRARGFSLVELAVTLIAAALLASIAVPSYRTVVERQQVAACIADLRKLALSIEKFRASHNGALPLTLEEMVGVPLLDPWGRPFRYLNFATPDAKTSIRKDHNLHPLNSEFDLYSVGPDGRTAAPLTAKASRDDVVWARDGRFVGKATEF